LTKILETENISKKFGGLQANEKISFYINKGEILGLIGPNGSGKSTLINILSGNLKPDEGRITFKGMTINGLQPHKICKLGLSRTYQTALPFKGMKVVENVTAGFLFGKNDYKLQTAINKASDLLKVVGLEEKLDSLAEDLTGADIKRLELAKALAGEPDLLLLDEVMAGLNLKEIDNAMELIIKIKNSGVTVLVVEHVMKAVMGISERIMVLQSGRLIASGTPNEICSNERVISAYLGAKFCLKGSV
jgi:branched-chain amino acid transport system ATP-binding protein